MAWVCDRNFVSLCQTKSSKIEQIRENVSVKKIREFRYTQPETVRHQFAAAEPSLLLRGGTEEELSFKFYPHTFEKLHWKCSQLEYTYMFSRKSKHFSKCFLRFGRLKLNVFLSDFFSSKSAEKHTYPIKAWVCDVGIFQARHGFVIEIIQERHVLW